MIIAIISLSVLTCLSFLMYFYSVGLDKQRRRSEEVRAEIANKLVRYVEEEPRELKRDVVEAEVEEVLPGIMLGEKAKEGVTFNSDINCQIVRIFYNQDKRFGIVCPVINSHLADIPGLVEIKDGERISWESISEVDQEVVTKAATVYEIFKTTNKDKFKKGIQ